MAFAEAGGPVLGICNGFQVLTERGLLPGALMRNSNLKFLCHAATLRVETNDSPFTSEFSVNEVITLPIAHNEGNYFADHDTLAELEGEDRIAFRYCTDNGEVSPESAPNGSIKSIAGVLSNSRRVLGMMPHPERAVDEAHNCTDGRHLIKSMVKRLS